MVEQLKRRVINWKDVALVLLLLIVILLLAFLFFERNFYIPSNGQRVRLTEDDASGLFLSPPASTQPAAQPTPALLLPVPPSAEALEPEHLIIRTGNISMVVDDTRAAQKTIEDYVAGLAGEGAFVVSSKERGGTAGQAPSLAMVIRVPASRFDEMMDNLTAMAVKINSRDVSAQDVTEEYVDLQAQLESLETARRRLLNIVSNAQTTKDLLDAEAQLTKRESEIEQIKGRMQYLQQSAQLSSISIDLQPNIINQPVTTGWRPAETVRIALEALVKRAQNFVDRAIFFVIADFPWWVAFGLVAFGLVRVGLWGRARLRKQKEKLPSDTPAENRT